MKIEMMSLTKCLQMRHAKNPKEHDLNALIGSYRRFGFVSPPMIDEKTETMVAGHGRCEALEQLRSNQFPPPEGITIDKKTGEWLVPVVRGVEFRTDAERDAYVIADNQHVMTGGWDMDRLVEMMKDIGDAGYEGLGFDAIDLQSLGMAVDELLGGGEDDKTKVREHDRDKNGQGAKPRGGELQYRLVVACKDEKHQAALLEELEAKGLEVKPLIV